MNKQNIVFLSVVAFAFSVGATSWAQGDALPQDETPAVPMLSGGVGEDEMAQIKAAEHQYNLKLLFTAVNGEYYSDVPVKITDAKGHVVVDTVARGPVFLATLPAGRYTLQASTDDNSTVTQRITVDGKTLRSYQIRFGGKK